METVVDELLQNKTINEHSSLYNYVNQLFVVFMKVSSHYIQ